MDVWPTSHAIQDVPRRRGRPKALLILTDDERVALAELVNNEAAEPHMALRARVVLACATGAPNVAVAALFGEAPYFVDTWRQRFVQRRIEGLLDPPEAVPKVTSAVARFEEAVAEAVRQIPCSDVELRGAIVRVTVRLP